MAQPASRVGRTTISVWVAAVLAIGATIGNLVITGSGEYRAAAAPSGAASKTFVWHDSTTDRMMMNVANAGAVYALNAPDLTANTVPKATDADSLEDSVYSDDGTDAAVSGKFTADDLIVRDSGEDNTITITTATDEVAARVVTIPELGGNVKMVVDTADMTADTIPKASGAGTLVDSDYTESDLKYIKAMVSMQ